MAIVNSVWLRNASKQLGGVVLYNAMGQTRSRELAANVTNPRTTAQMTQRTRWANLVNFYRANASWMKFAYETKSQNQSEYNKFMSLNIPSSKIYLPKSVAAQGGCIVDSYQMTQGTLNSIEVTKQTNSWATNLYLPADFNISSTSTVGEVASALLQSNPALREGDQISFIRFTQQTNSNSGVPYVVVRRYEVLLNTDNLQPFYNYMPSDYIIQGVLGNGKFVAVKDSGNAGGFCLILSRTSGGRTFVSTQEIIVANNRTLIESFSTSAAIQNAIDSYGTSSDPFLTSTTANEDSQAAVGVSVTYAEIDEEVITPGTIAKLNGLSQDADVTLHLNGNLGNITADGMYLTYWAGGQRKTETLTGVGNITNSVHGFVDGHQEDGAVWIEDILVQSSQGDYRAVFRVPNEATIIGLE